MENWIEVSLNSFDENGPIKSFSITSKTMKAEAIYTLIKKAASNIRGWNIVK